MEAITKIKDIYKNTPFYSSYSNFVRGENQLSSEQERERWLKSLIKMLATIIGEEDEDIKKLKEVTWVFSNHSGSYAEFDYGNVEDNVFNILKHLIDCAEVKLKISNNMQTSSTTINITNGNIGNIQTGHNSVQNIGFSLEQLNDFMKSREEATKQLFAKLYEELDNVEIKYKTVYEGKVANWLPNWKRLLNNSQVYLVSAEFLFENMTSPTNFQSEDFSPYILQLCRVIENEFANFIFGDFNNYLSTKFSDTNKLNDLISDAKLKINFNANPKINIYNLDGKTGNDTMVFYTILKDQEFMLGKMIKSLQAVSNTSTLHIHLIQEFNNYIAEKFNDKSKLLNPTLIDKIDNLRKTYRNNSAHPDIMTKTEAENCKILVESILVDYIQNIK